jgi:hypothetical protein
MTTGSTNKDGQFRMQVQVTKPARVPRMTLTVESNGYVSSRKTVRPRAGTNLALSFRIKPTRRLGSVKGRVTNAATGLGIPNASIAILIDGYSQPRLSATSGVDGKYVIERVGFSGSLTLRASLPEQPCVSPITRIIDAYEAGATQDIGFRLSVQPDQNNWNCSPIDRSEVSRGAQSRSEPATSPGLRRVSTPRAAQAASGKYAKPAVLEVLRRKPTPANPARPLLLDDPSIQWLPSSIDAIDISDSLNAWNSGHINDILKIGPTEALVAAHTSGVWSVAWSSLSASALPLSTTWGSIGMSSLAQGPDGANHVYAGTNDWSGLLWETDTSTSTPLLNWVAHNVSNTTSCGNINHILVIPVVRRIVLACATGVWWSAIPGSPAAQGIYNWQQAQIVAQGQMQALAGGFARLAQGPGWGAGSEGSVAASAWGGAAPEQVVFTGGWSNGQLVFTRGLALPPPGSLSVTLGRSTLASCPLDPSNMYLIGADANDNDLAGVWKSGDGGQTFTFVNLPAGAGGGGGYNQALAVSPSDCNTFAVGWQNAAFVSFDGGNSYPMELNDAASGCGDGPLPGCQLHADFHALLFDPGEPTTLWMGTDGGLSSVGGVGAGGTLTFASYYNQHLWDLQFYHVSPSFQTTNLVAGPLQDNCVLYSVVPDWWTRVPGCGGDGAYTEFAGVGPAASGADTLVWTWPAGTGAPAIFEQSVWDGSEFGSASTIPVAGGDQNCGDGNGNVYGPNWNIRRPSYTNGAGQFMYVVMGDTTNVCGLFGNTDGSGLHWENLASIGAGENVNAVSSFNGNVVFVGTDHGNICQLTAPYDGSGTCVNFNIDYPGGGNPPAINGIAEIFSSIAFAAAGNYILQFTGQNWQPAGSLPSSLNFVGVDGPGLTSIFAANASQVFVTHDLGTTWQSASDGLPAVANSKELHYVVQPDGNAYMYLATYGWSVFRAQLH